MHDHALERDSLLAVTEEMREIRHTIHAYPELAYEEFKTSDLVAERLTAWGYTVTRGVGGTGVVATLRAGTSARSVGVRADMDALPIVEETGLPYASQSHGRMHACGHDGHTAMLLGAARQLAERKAFDGTLHLIFQPAEEHGRYGGGRKMIEDGLFERFPCDAIFGLHNMPGIPEGKLAFRVGPMMASIDAVTIHVDGVGGHGAMPHLAVDPVVVAASIVLGLQTVVSRNVDPLKSAVVTVGAIHGGDAMNVIPRRVTLQVSVRSFDPAVRKMMQQRITTLVEAQAASFGATAEIDYQLCYPAVVNTPAETAFAMAVAKDWVGEGQMVADTPPLMASEDFAYMLEQRPGCYFFLGNGAGEHSCMVHNPGYDFNDNCLPIGAGFWVRLVERYLA